MNDTKFFEGIAVRVGEIARDTGRYIKEEAAHFSAQDVEEKGVHDLVSYVDKLAERRIVEALKPILPNAGYITEEETLLQHGEQYNWIVDPLDGTTNFVHGVPTFSVSIALTYLGEVVVGAVYEINRRECFLAWKGGGAYLNEEAIRVSENQELSKSLLATGFPFRSAENLDAYLAVLKTFMQSTRGIRRIGSAAVDLAYTACGRFDCFFEFNLQNYDMAAGILLVQEAGGLIKDFSGGKQMLEKGSVIAGSPAMTEVVFKEINKYFNG